MKKTLSGILLALCFDLSLFGATPKAQAAGSVPPSFCEVTGNGVSKTWSVTPGTIVWGDTVSGIPGNTIVALFTVPTTVTVKDGCREPNPTTNIIGRKGWLDSLYGQYGTIFKCYIDFVAYSCVPPTATPTITASQTFTATATPTASNTWTPTSTRTATPSASSTRTWTPSRTATFTRSLTPSRTATSTRSLTPSRTATLTPSATATATPIVVPRNDIPNFITYKSYAFKVGQVVWCKSFNGEPFTIRKMAITQYFPVPIDSCGVQVAPPYDTLDALLVYLKKNTPDNWVVIR